MPTFPIRVEHFIKWNVGKSFASRSDLWFHWVIYRAQTNNEPPVLFHSLFVFNDEFLTMNFALFQWTFRIFEQRVPFQFWLLLLIRGKNKPISSIWYWFCSLRDAQLNILNIRKKQIYHNGMAYTAYHTIGNQDNSNFNVCSNSYMWSCGRIWMPFFCYLDSYTKIIYPFMDAYYKRPICVS